jgi:hypothetical protein
MNETREQENIVIYIYTTNEGDVLLTGSLRFFLAFLLQTVKRNKKVQKAKQLSSIYAKSFSSNL